MGYNKNMQNNLFLIYLGRTGSIPKFILDFSKEIIKDNKISNFKLLISEHNLLKEEILSTKKDTFILNTPIKTIDSLLKLPYFIKKSIKILNQAKKENNKNFLFTMTHIWNPILMILIKIFIKKPNIYYISHDANLHPGEKNLKLQISIIWLEIFLSKNIITLTENVKNILKKKWKNKNIIVLEHPAYDFGKITPPRSLNPIPTFLFFGRIVKYKGLDLFLEAIEIFDKKAKELNINYKIIIAGSGEIEKQTRNKINNNKNIELINRYIDEKEIPNIWDKSDICTLPYIEASQSGVIAIAVNKAMPCLITPMDGLLEQVIENNNSMALISKDISPTEFAKIMLEILDKNIYTSLSRNTLVFQEKYSWKIWIDELVK